MAKRRLKVVLKTKRGYRQDGYSRGVLFILLAFDTVVRSRLRGVPATAVLTAGTNDHSAGAHFRREAEDLRSKTFPSGNAKRVFLAAVMAELQPVTKWKELEHGYGVWTKDYYGELEYEGQRREHFHVQVRIGHTIGLSHQRHS